MIRLAKSSIGESEKAAVQAVLDREYLGMGSEVKAFEQDLGLYFGGARQVVCVSTGTSALHLAAQAIGLGPGDEVLVPSLTFVATFQAISATGATPIPCDVEESTGFLDLKSAEENITQRTCAVVPVHYAGEPGNMDAVLAFAKTRSLRVIEDAAHAFGSVYGGQKIGAFGDVTCFSFDGIKNITSGEGGAIVTSDLEVISRVSDARLLGVCRDSEMRYQQKRSWDFDVVDQGWRYHMSDIMAAIGRVQLKRFETEFRPKRKQLAVRYRERLADSAAIKFFQWSSETGVPFMMPVRVVSVGDSSLRDRLRAHLLEKGIEVGIHYKPNHLLTKYRTSGHLPVSERLYREMLTLPLHHDLTLDQVDQVCDEILNFR